MSEKPPWRKAIEDYERSIGAPLEDFIKSDEFADIAAKAAKGQAELQREMTASTTKWLHTMGLPTAADMAQLRAEIQELRAEVRALSDAVAPKPAKPAPKAAKPAPKAKKTTPKPKPKPE